MKYKKDQIYTEFDEFIQFTNRLNLGDEQPLNIREYEFVRVMINSNIKFINKPNIIYTSYILILYIIFLLFTKSNINISLSHPVGSIPILEYFSRILELNPRYTYERSANSRLISSNGNILYVTNTPRGLRVDYSFYNNIMSTFDNYRQIDTSMILTPNTYVLYSHILNSDLQAYLESTHPELNITIT